MAKKVNFSMVNAEAVAKTQTASDAIFVHAMECVTLAKAKKTALAKVDKVLKDEFGGEIAKLRDAIRREEYKDTEVVDAIRELGRIDYKRTALSKWYKDEISKATDYFRLDDIIEELGANNLENGVRKVDAILGEIYGLDKVGATARLKFARRVYSAMDGQKKSSMGATTKGKLLTERSRREIKEVGLRAMCEYVAHTTNITLKTKEDYEATVEYDKDLTTVTNYGFKNI